MTLPLYFSSIITLVHFALKGRLGRILESVDAEAQFTSFVSNVEP